MTGLVEQGGMFFVFGMPRSGTTLLARMLNAHPDVLVPHETDFIVPLAFLMDRIANPAVGRPLLKQLVCGTAGFAASLGEFLDPATVAACIDGAPYRPADILHALSSAMAQRAGKRLVGDKSPNDLNFIRILDKTGAITPPVRVLHIVRDVRDVMVSLGRTGWADDLDRWFPRQWANQNLYLHDRLQGQPHYHLLRYEDLVAAPEQHARRLCAWLGVPWHPAMLHDAARAHPRYADMPHHARLASPIGNQSIGQFRHAVPPALAARWAAQAAEGLRRFDYPD